MDEQRPRRRRELTPEERKNLSRQQLKERDQMRKQQRREARIREQARREARRRGEDSHIVIEIPASPPKQKSRAEHGFFVLLSKGFEGRDKTCRGHVLSATGLRMKEARVRWNRTASDGIRKKSLLLR